MRTEGEACLCRYYGTPGQRDGQRFLATPKPSGRRSERRSGCEDGAVRSRESVGRCSPRRNYCWCQRCRRAPTRGNRGKWRRARRPKPSRASSLADCTLRVAYERIRPAFSTPRARAALRCMSKTAAGRAAAFSSAQSKQPGEPGMAHYDGCTAVSDCTGSARVLRGLKSQSSMQPGSHCATPATAAGETRRPWELPRVAGHSPVSSID